MGFPIPRIRPPTLAPVRADASVLNASGAITTVADVEVLLGQSNSLLTALTLAGFEIPAVVMSVGSGTSVDQVAVDTTWWSVAVADPTDLDASVGAAVGVPANDVGWIAFRCVPRSDFGRGPGTGASGDTAPPFDLSTIVLDGRAAFTPDRPDEPDDLAGWLVVGSETDETTSWETAFAALQPAADSIANGLGQAWLAGGHTWSGTTGVGLLGMYRPRIWFPDYAGPDLERVEVTWRAENVSRLLDASPAESLPVGPAASFLAGEVGTSTTPAEDRLADARILVELDPAHAWTDSGVLAAMASRLCDVDHQPTTVRPAPIAAADFRSDTWTDIVLTMHQIGAIDVLSGLEGAAILDVRSEVSRILDDVAPTDRTDDDWALLSTYVTDHHGDPADDGALASAAADALILAFDGHDQSQQFSTLTALVTAAIERPQSSSPADVNQIGEEDWWQTTRADFEFYARAVAVCLIQLDEQTERKPAFVHAHAIVQNAASSVWLDERGVRGKLAYLSLLLAEQVPLTEAQVPAIVNAATIWQQETSGEDDAAANWFTWDMFFRAAVIAEGMLDLPDGNEEVRNALRNLHDHVLGTRLPALHQISDAQVTLVNASFATKLLELVRTTGLGTTQSKYYHGLIAQTSDQDFGIRQLINPARLAEEMAALREDPEIVGYHREGHAHAAQEVLSISDFDEMVREHSAWMRSDAWLGLIAMDPDGDQLLQAELNRLAAFDDQEASNVNLHVISRMKVWKAMRSGPQLFTDDQLAEGYAIVMEQLGMSAAEAVTASRGMAVDVRRVGVAVSWLARFEASDVEYVIPSGGTTRCFNWKINYGTGQNVSASRLIPGVRLVAALGTLALLGVGVAVGDEGSTPSGLTLAYLASIGITAQVLVDAIDLAYAVKGSPRFIPALADFIWVPMGEYAGIIATGRWFVETRVMALPSWGSWVATQWVPTRFAQATLAVRFAAAVGALLVGALIETWAGIMSAHAASEAYARGEYAQMRVELGHMLGSALIVAGSVIAIAAMWGCTVPIVGWAFAAWVGTAFILAGIAVHVVSWALDPSWFEAGRLESDLRSMNVLSTANSVAAPIDGRVTTVEDFAPAGRPVGTLLPDDITVEGDAGDWYDLDLPYPPDTGIDYDPSDTVVFGVEDSSRVVLSNVGMLDVAAGDEVATVAQRYLIEITAAEQPTPIAEPGEVMQGDVIATVVTGPDQVDIVAPDTGIVVWLDEPESTGIFSNYRYGLISIA